MGYIHNNKFGFLNIINLINTIHASILHNTFKDTHTYIYARYCKLVNSFLKLFFRMKAKVQQTFSKMKIWAVSKQNNTLAEYMGFGRNGNNPYIRKEIMIQIVKMLEDLTRDNSQQNNSYMATPTWL